MRKKMNFNFLNSMFFKFITLKGSIKDKMNINPQYDLNLFDKYSYFNNSTIMSDSNLNHFPEENSILKTEATINNVNFDVRRRSTDRYFQSLNRTNFFRHQVNHFPSSGSNSRKNQQKNSGLQHSKNLRFRHSPYLRSFEEQVLSPACLENSAYSSQLSYNDNILSGYNTEVVVTESSNMLPPTNLIDQNLQHIQSYNTDNNLNINNPTFQNDNNPFHNSLSFGNEYQVKDIENPHNPKIEKKIHIQKNTNKIKEGLNKIWSTYILNEINIIEPGLLEYLANCKEKDKWKPLDNNCRIFHENIEKSIQVHTPVIFENIKIYRKVYLDDKNTLRYGCLILKGKPGDDFKNLTWYGGNIFVMDSSNVGSGVFLHKFTYIGPGCEIGSNTTILNNCFLKSNVKIEEYTLIGNNNFFGEGCTIGYKKERDCTINSGDSLSKNNISIEKLSLKDEIHKTIVCGFNFVCNNIVFPGGIVYDAGNTYYTTDVISD